MLAKKFRVSSYLLGSLVGIEPLDGLAALVGDGLDLFGGDLVLDLVVLDGLLHLESIGLELVLQKNGKYGETSK